jgi:fatty acid desaturase
VTDSMLLDPPTRRDDCAQTRPGSDFSQLNRLVKAAGLLDRRPGYYALRIGAVLAAYLGGLVAFFVIGNSWWQLVVAAGMAVVFAQTALVAHDVAHRQVFRSGRRSRVAGLLAGNLGIGMSYGWWMDKHTRHHANPNHSEHDPDVAPEFLVWSTDQARASSGIARVVSRWQAFLFFPLLTLLGVNMHVSGVRVLARRGVRHRGIEAALLAVHLIGYLAVLFLMLPAGKAFAFLAVHQMLFGVYLGCTFAPNHKGMPMPTEDLDFLRKQVLTSRNVRGGTLVDIVLGGLNYQIEHHLFPSMPTPHLRKARPIVRQFCAERQVPYTETSLIRSYAEALRHLHRVGAPLRRARTRQ